MRDLFVVISGAPGSGKSTLAAPLARALAKQILDA
jgi:adenylate kinase family enzyme